MHFGSACSSPISSSLSLTSAGHKKFLHSVWHPESFPCDVSISNNWTSGSLLWFQNDLWSQKTVVNVTMWRSSSYWPWMRNNDISLLLPSVSSRDVGNYTCEVMNQTQSRYYSLEVTAKSGVIWSKRIGVVIHNQKLHTSGMQPYFSTSKTRNFRSETFPNVDLF